MDTPLALTGDAALAACGCSLHSSPLGKLVLERPARARVLEKFGLDYCCGGAQTLQDACQKAGLNLAEVEEALRTADAQVPVLTPDEDLRTWTVGQLIDHLLGTHHTYLKSEMPRLMALSHKVSSVHGGRHPELVELNRIVQELMNDLFQHLQKEEQILFPMCRELERQAGPLDFHCGSVANPIRVMRFEHDSAGQSLHELRRLSGGYAVPADACGSFRALYDGLATFELDMFAHVHKENNVLFPRVLEFYPVSE